MASLSIRVEAKTLAALRVISKDEHRPISQIVTDLVERYRREKFWRDMHEGFSRLKADPVAWQEYQAEVALWDSIAGETLANEPPYYTAEEEAEIDAGYRRALGG
jgi:hypothetical protein